MLTRPPPVRRGDVVASGGTRGVVWRIIGDVLVVLPILNSGRQTYRGDEPITEFRDMVQCGVGGLDLVVRPARACRVRASKQVRIGRLSDPLLARIQRAVDRECTTAAFEHRWEGLTDTSRENGQGPFLGAAPDPF